MDVYVATRRQIENKKSAITTFWRGWSKILSLGNLDWTLHPQCFYCRVYHEVYCVGILGCQINRKRL